MEQELTKKLISINSQLSFSNKKIVSFLDAQLRNIGADVKISRYLSEDVIKYNILAVWNKSSKESPLIFSGHTDTVDKSEGWIKDPLIPRKKSNDLIGLGSSDMKGSIASFIVAIKKSNKFTRPVYMLLDGDEEGAGEGGKLLTKKKLAKNCTVIVGEPTDGKIRLGQKECYDLKITTTGNSMHASLSRYRSNENENAIVKMSRIIEAVRKYEKKIDNRKDLIYKNSTLSYGLLSGGTSVNTIADTANLLVNRRLVPKESFKKDFSELKKVIKKIDPKAGIKINFYGGPYNVNKNKAWVKKMLSVIKKKTNRKMDIIYKLGWTEASLFNGWGKVMIIGPGNLASIHKPNEKISIKELERTTKLYKLFIKDSSL